MGKQEEVERAVNIHVVWRVWCYDSLEWTKVWSQRWRMKKNAVRTEFEFKRDCTRQLVMYLGSSDNTCGREFG